MGNRKNNGDGSVFQRADGRWVAKLQVGIKANGKADIRTKYAKTEAEAKRKLREMKKTAYQETPEQRRKQTVEKYILDWFPRYKKGLKPASYDRQENSINHQIVPFFGSHQIHAVVPSDVKDLMNRLQYERGYAYSTVKKAYDTLNECLRQAVEDGLLERNPCNKKNKPKEADFVSLDDEDDVRVLTDAEIERFCREALCTYSNGKPVYRLAYAFILILNTGIRVGEALALRTHGDIDFKRRLMKIDSNMSYVKQREPGGNGKKYPGAVRAGWMSALINAGEGVDIDVFLRRENRGKTLDRVAQRIRLNRTKLRGVQDTSTDYDELQSSIAAGYAIKQGISQYNEDLFYMSIFITVSAMTYDELAWRRQQIVDMLKSMDMATGDCNFQQEAALNTVMPFLRLDANLEKKSRRNILTSGAASTYMFTSFELSDDNGILLGVNRHNNSLCIVDLFNTKINKNANVTLLGTSGSGKTFTMQLMALRMRMRGIQCYILAPLKGHEFRRACNRIGGEYIKISPGSKHCINVMEIRRTISPEMELIDEIDYNDSDSLLARKIQQLMIFFSLLIPDLSNEEEQMLDEALVKTYAGFGITHDNSTVFSTGTMPILGDLHRHLTENQMTARIAAIVSRFVTGSAQSFNQQTNVDLSNKYVVLDISELKGKLLPVGMMIALDYVWDNIKADRTLRNGITQNKSI